MRINWFGLLDVQGASLLAQMVMGLVHSKGSQRKFPTSQPQWLYLLARHVQPALYVPGPENKIEVECDKSGARVVQNAGWLLDSHPEALIIMLYWRTHFPTVCPRGPTWLGMVHGQERIKPFLKNLMHTNK